MTDTMTRTTEDDPLADEFIFEDSRDEGAAGADLPGDILWDIDTGGYEGGSPTPPPPPPPPPPPSDDDTMSSDPYETTFDLI